jgi:hypothetical protein
MTPKIEEHPDESKQLTASRWREAFLTWFDTWQDEPQLMPSGHRRASGRLLRAGIGLAQVARADGDLRPPGGGFWSAKQLALAMSLAERQTLDTLAWFAQEGWLTVTKGKTTAEGQGVDERRLLLPRHPQPISPGNQPQLPQPVSMGNLETEGAQLPKRGSPASPSLLSPASPVDLNGDALPVFPGFPVSRPTEEEVQARGRDGSSGILDIGVVDVQVTDGEGDDPAVQLTAPAVEPTPPPQDVPEVGPKISIRQRFYRRRVRTRIHGDGAVLTVNGNEITVKLDRDGDQRRYYAADLEVIPDAAKFAELDLVETQLGPGEVVTVLAGDRYMVFLADGTCVVFPASELKLLQVEALV